MKTQNTQFQNQLNPTCHMNFDENKFSQLIDKIKPNIYITDEEINNIAKKIESIHCSSIWILPLELTNKILILAGEERIIIG